MRTLVDLPDEQVRELAKICEREGCSRAEVVRRAVAEYLKARTQSSDDDAFGLWRARGIDALSYQDALRREGP